MVENTLTKHLNNRQIRVTEEANSFDLEDFYMHKTPSTGAVCLITPSQMLMTECFIKDKSGYGTHIMTADEIYKAIYGKAIVDDEDWEKQIIEDGNIIMNLCFEVPTTIWIPNKMNSEQYEMLENFANRINIIVYQNPDYFIENPIEFLFKIGDDPQEYTSINELSPLFDKLNKGKRR